MHYFAKHLLQWYETSPKKEMPWRSSRNPYHIWISEIILQQTRVAQGLPYYKKFIKKYPTINDLAKAPENEVMKLWEGLGYYSRARNLHATAKYISQYYTGIFPNKYSQIIALKGVGSYTAAAIASFAFNLPHAVVDGNVVRVLARFKGIHYAYNTALGKKTFGSLAQSMIKDTPIAIYNQAIMEFGADICTPRNPQCTQCPLQKKCVAYILDSIAILPVKSKKINIKVRHLYFFDFYVSEKKQFTHLIHKRDTKDIWQGLHEFPLVDSWKKIDIKKTLFWKKNITILNTITITESTILKHKLSHQHLYIQFFTIHCKKLPTINTYYAISRKKLLNLGFPVFFLQYFKKY